MLPAGDQRGADRLGRRFSDAKCGPVARAMRAACLRGTTAGALTLLPVRRRRLMILVGLIVSGLVTAVPVVAGAADDRGGAAGLPRILHPQDSSGEVPEWVALPVAPGEGATTRSGLVRWRVAPGVTYATWRQTDARGAIVAHLLTIDPETPGVRIDYASRPKVRQMTTVRDIVRLDHAVAGVNGDFYDIGYTGAPLGLGKDRQRGLLHARAIGWNSAFFIDRDGHADIDDLPMTATVDDHPELAITNLNSPFVSPDGIGVYTRRWGRTAGYQVTRGQTRQVRAVKVRDHRVVANRRKLSTDQPIKGVLLIGRGKGAAQLRALTRGTAIRVHHALHGRPRMAISGNHFLIRDGLIKAVDDRVLAPRTAVGVESDTRMVLFLVVDGRSTTSRGYTMVELANLMAELGADEAINLDGGGSSTMVAKNQRGRLAVLNAPSDGHQRHVSNAIEVTYSKPAA
jgi:hypothetical protein